MTPFLRRVRGILKCSMLGFVTASCLSSVEEEAGIGSTSHTLASSAERVTHYRSASGVTVIIGTSHDDILNGTSGTDCIVGNGGRDIIDAGPGNDVVFGGDGDDTITGGSGDDQLFGGSGRDTLSGGDGNDQLIDCSDHTAFNGGSGTDNCQGDNPGDDSEPFANCELEFSSCP